MLTYLTEYRINKKGAECYRTRSREEAVAKLTALNARRPVYTLQARTCRTERGVTLTDPSGRPMWSPWFND